MLEQADVLVNTVANESPDLRKAGAISKAFVTAGGPQLQQVIFFYPLLVELL